MDNTHGWCPNHEDALSVGFCNGCGGGFCARCLYVVPGQYGLTLYYCPECADKGLAAGSRQAIVLVILAAVASLIAVGLLFSGSVIGLVSLPGVVFGALWGLYLFFHPPSLLTVFDQQHAQDRQV